MEPQLLIFGNYIKDVVISVVGGFLMGELRSTSMLPERYDSGIASDSDQETTDGSLDNIRNEEAEISRMLAKWVISVMTQKKPSPIPSKIEKYAPTLMKVIERLLLHLQICARKIHYIYLSSDKLNC